MDTTLYPLDYPALAREALTGGFTQAIDGFRPTRGYAVSTRKDAERSVDLADSDNHDPWNVQRVADALYHYVVDHGHDLRRGYLLGAWRDGDRVILDLVRVFRDYDEAIDAAQDADQDAIYDLGAGVTITLADAAAARAAIELAEHPELDTDDRELDARREER